MQKKCPVCSKTYDVIHHRFDKRNYCSIGCRNTDFARNRRKSLNINN